MLTTLVAVASGVSAPILVGAVEDDMGGTAAEGTVVDEGVVLGLYVDVVVLVEVNMVFNSSSGNKKSSASSSYTVEGNRPILV